MNEREPKGTSLTFTRGSEIWWHQANLLIVAARNAVIVSLVVCAAFCWLYVEFFFPKDRFDQFLQYSTLMGWESIGLTGGNATITIDGVEQNVPAVDAVRLLEPHMAEPMRLAWNTLVFSLVGLLSGLVVTVLALYGFGQRKMQDTHLRGASLVKGNELKSLLEAREDSSPYSIADVPMRKGAETLHTLLVGGQGTGKSQQFFAMMDQVRGRKKRAIVFDPSGEFTATYYRPGIDVILNPMDQRSPNWTAWNEIREDYHYDNIANGLLPEPPGDTDPFFAIAGRHVLKDTLKVLGKEGKRTNKSLYESISLNGLEALNAILAGTPGATYTDPKTEKTGMSLKMTVQNQLESFRFLRDDGEAFSIRDWIANDGESWLFISTREAQADAIRPLLSLWINIAIQAVLDLEPIHQERLWFFIDEFPRLQKMDSIELALTNTRKYGLCMVLGLQDFGQLRETYGNNIAQTIISQCQTKLLLRISDGKAAKALAELIGQAEFDERKENVSFGVNSERDGVNIQADRRLRDLVLSSQILRLPDMAGYLTTPGDYPTAYVSYKYQKRAKVSEGFIRRNEFAELPRGRVLAPNLDAVKGLGATVAPTVVDGDTSKVLTAQEVNESLVSPNERQLAMSRPLANAL